MVRRRVPVVLVAGFLGSGKTSLLNHLLRGDHGVRIGVIVNDFGAVNIDSMMVAGQVDSTVSLSNGCLCCAVDVSEMDTMLDRLTQPRSNIDVIVVEASGLAEPRNMVRMILGSENPRIGYGGLVVLVDAAEFEDSRRRHPELDLHVRMADLVVLNKIDRLTEEGTAAVRGSVDALADRAPVLPATHGRIDPRLLFDEVVRVDDGPRQLSLDELLVAGGHEHDECGHVHLHDHYRSVSFTSDAPMDPRALVRFLESPPAGLYRSKGFVYFDVPGHTQRYRLQTVGRHIRFDRGSWGRGERRGTELVLIGSGMDTAAVERELRACVAEGSEVAGPETMTGVHRYVVES
ncbi:CobW family GTP-binding protein [Rhodococcus sp. NPDC003318]|uniref:CobW family GTP-binding protein n=1 Tax=Rhodococcus sp. NPDC003318 TaxID=3364503 RepID=UPI0036977996